MQIWLHAHTHIHAFRRRNTPLHDAANYGHAAVAAALLEHGADVNATNNFRCVLPVAILGNGRRAPRRTHSRGNTHAHIPAYTHTGCKAPRARTRCRTRTRTHPGPHTHMHVRTVVSSCLEYTHRQGRARVRALTHKRNHPDVQTSRTHTSTRTHRRGRARWLTSTQKCAIIILTHTLPPTHIVTCVWA